MLVTYIYANDKALFIKLASGLKEAPDTYSEFPSVVISSFKGPKGLTLVLEPSGLWYLPAQIVEVSFMSFS